MKKFLLSILMAATMLTMVAQPPMGPRGPENEFSDIEGTTALTFNLPFSRDVKGRAGHGPQFYLFPDQKLDAQSAKTLVTELGLIDWAKDYAGGVVVVNPTAEKWQAADVQAFRELLGRRGPATNIKVIGIGRGATFVNQQLAASDMTGAIAGIVAINGAAGKKVALAHFRYINPLPKNTAEVLKKYPKVVVAEQNMGQLAGWLRMKVDGFVPQQYNEVKGQPFKVAELVEAFNQIINK